MSDFPLAASDARFAASATVLPASAVTALQQGNKIDAIKAIRAEQRLGLKEAKDLVDAYLSDHPALDAVVAETRATTSAALGRWLVVVALLAAALYYLLALA